MRPRRFMDCRVKPGNDNGARGRIALSGGCLRSLAAGRRL